MGVPVRALDHRRLWAAIDAIAAGHGLSPSALARRAGLDATAFNRSKRITADGRPRWPSTESIAKILAATGVDLDDFVRLIDPRGDRRPPAPVLPFLQGLRADPPGFADDGGNAAAGLPPLDETETFAFALTAETAVEPYRPGDVLIASASAQIRKGDRVLVATGDGTIAVRLFGSRNARTTALADLADPCAALRLRSREVLWIARILWASQ